MAPQTIQIESLPVIPVCPICHKNLLYVESLQPSRDSGYRVCPTTVNKFSHYHYRRMQTTTPFSNIIHFATVAEFEIMLKENDQILTVSSFNYRHLISQKDNANLQDFVNIYNRYQNLKVFS